MSEAGIAETSRRFGCPGCGGGLRYDIASGEMKCDRCGSLTPVGRIGEDTGPDGDSLEVTEYHCPQCGAMVYSTDTSVTSFCSFCGSDVVLTGKLGRTRRPAAILPFTVTREACEAAYRSHLSHYRLMPADLKSVETISHFRPVYVPFWSYRVQSEGEPTLKGSKSYTSGHYRYDEEYELTMHAEIDQKDILYDASEAFEDETAALLRHTAGEAVPFHSAYLSGFYAQAADVAPETYRDEAAATAVRMFMRKVKEEYFMDTVEITGDTEHSFGLPNAVYTEKLIMMPVWLLASRQGERVIYTAINGRSGEVVCDIPVSGRKTVIAAAVLTAALFALLALTLTMKPDLLMGVCAALLLVTQYQFSGAQKALSDRKTRAFEPDFKGDGHAFNGPAQALLKRKGKGSVAVAGDTKKKNLQNASAVILVAALFLAYLVTQNGSLSDNLRRLPYMLSGSFLTTVLIVAMGAMLVVMGIHIGRRLRRRDSGPKLPRLVSFAACLAGLLFLALGMAEDLLYYGCACAMLLSAIWELVLVNRAHNEYASRPVPYFGEKEAGV